MQKFENGNNEPFKLQNAAMNIHKHKAAVAKFESGGNMSPETKNFIQKICYKQSASVDMTTNGFMRDSKVRPVKLLIKPLQEQLQRICGKTEKPSRKTSSRKRNNKATSPIRIKKIVLKIDSKQSKNSKEEILELIKMNAKEKRKLSVQFKNI